jgi:hypothetical protein
MELLVALVLSVLVLGMVLPLLAMVTRPPAHLELPPEPAWRRAIQADLLELVSPAKSAVPVINILPVSDTRPFPDLILQSFCRAGDSHGGAAARGPSQVKYTLELEAGGGFALVRSAAGWHDSDTSRQVLAEHLTAWEIILDPPLRLESSSMRTAEGQGPPPPLAEATGGRARVTLHWLDRTVSADLWIPRISPERQLAPEELPAVDPKGEPMEDHL